MFYNSDYNRYKLEELKKLKRFFESCVKDSDKTKSVAGHFGAGYSVFLVMLYNIILLIFRMMQCI